MAVSALLAGALSAGFYAGHEYAMPPRPPGAFKVYATFEDDLIRAAVESECLAHGQPPWVRGYPQCRMTSDGAFVFSDTEIMGLVMGRCARWGLSPAYPLCRIVRVEDA